MAIITKTVAQFLADDPTGWPYSAGDTVTIVDTGANIQSLTTTQITALGTNNVDFINASDDLIQFTAAQATALAGTSVVVNISDLFILSDTGANIAGISAADFTSLAARGLDSINPSNSVLTLDVDQYTAITGGSIAIDSSSTVTLGDTGANISALSAAQITALAGNGIDVINSTSGAISLTVAKYLALGTVVLTTGNTVNLVDTGANIATLTSTQIGDLAGDFIDGINASDDVLSLTLAQFNALGSVTLTAGDANTIADTGTNLAALTTTAIADLDNKLIDSIDATNNAVSFTVAQYNAFHSSVGFASADVVTLADTGANLAGLTTTEIGNLTTRDIDIFDATNNTITLTIEQLDALASASIALTTGDTVVLSDTQTNIELLTTTQLSGYVAQGVDRIDSTDDALDLTVAKVTAVLPGATFTAGDTVTIVDTGTNISAMTTTQIGQLAAGNVDTIDASSAISFTTAQYLQLGSVALTGSNTVNLVDTGTNIAALTSTQIGDLAGDFIDNINATNDALNLTVAQYTALGAVTLTAGDTNTLVDTGTNLGALTTTQIADLDNNLIDAIDASNNAVSFTTEQINSFHSSVALTAGDVVTVADTSTNIEALDETSIAAFITKGVDIFDASNNVLNITAAEADAVAGTAATFATGDVVTIADTSTNIEALSATTFGQLAAANIDAIDASDNDLDLTVAQYTALGTVTLAAGDAVSITDTGANIATLTATQIGQLSSKNVDSLDASNNVLNLTVAQYLALGSVTLTGADLNTILDTGANIATLTTTQLSALVTNGIDRINATDDTLNITVAQLTAIGTVAFDAGDTVTLLDTSTNLSALTTTQISALTAKGVEAINATNNSIVFTVAQATSLNSVTIDASDTFVLADTSTNLAALTTTQITNLVSAGLDRIDSTNDVVSFTLAQTNAMGAAQFTTTDVVTISDSQANIEALNTTQISGYSTAGVDFFDSTDNALNLTAAQFTALGNIALTTADTNTLVDSGANIAALTTTQITALGTKNFDAINSNTDALSLTVAQYLALGSVTLTSGDTVTLADTGTNIAALTSTQLGALAAANVDEIDASSALNLTTAQYLAVVGTSTNFVTGDTITLVDTGTNLANLTTTQIGELDNEFVDAIDASNNAINFTVAQVAAFHSSVAFTTTDVITIVDSQANIEAVTAVDLAAYVSKGVDVFNSTGDVLNLTTDKANAIAAGATFVTADIVTVADSGGNIGSLTQTQIAALNTALVDAVDASGDAFTWTVAKINALGNVDIATNDAVTVSDSGANFTALTTTQLTAIDNKSAASVTFDASDNAYSLTVAQLNALGATALTAGDTITLSDTQTNIQALTTTQISAFITKGIDVFSATGGTLNMTAAQIDTIANSSKTFATGNTVTLLDTSTNINAMSTTDIGQLAGANVDAIDASNNTISWSKAQLDQLGGVPLTSADVVTFLDTSTNIEALNAGNFTSYTGAGFDVDVFDATDNDLDLTTAQTNALIAGGAAFVTTDVVTIEDSGANLAALTVTQIANMASANVDAFDSNTNAVTFTVAQVNALGAITLTGGDTVTVADTQTNLEALTTTQIAALSTAGVDVFDSTDNALNLSVAQFNALGNISLTGADNNRIVDTGTAIGAMTTTQLGTLAAKGIDSIDATNGVLSISVAQYVAVGAVTFTSGDTITISDTSTNLNAMTTTQISGLAAANVDRIDATDDVLAWTQAQLNSLGSVALSTADTVSFLDTSTNIQALNVGDIGTYGSIFVDVFDATDNVLNFTTAQVNAMVSNSIVAATADTVKVVDTAANIQAMTTTQITNLAGRNVDSIDSSDNTLSLTVAQANALGAVTLTAADAVTVADTGANLAGLTATQIASLSTAGVDFFDASDNALSLTTAQANALGNIVLTSADNNKLVDTGANVALMTTTQINALAGKNFDSIDVSDNALSLTHAQFSSLGAVALTAADLNTIADTSTVLNALTATQITALGTGLIDKIDATNNTLSWTKAQFDALGAVTLTTADVITLADTSTVINALTTGQLSTLISTGVDAIDTTNNTLSLSVAQFEVLRAAGITIAAGDTVTLVDNSTNIAAMTTTQITGLATVGVDSIDSSNNVVNFTTAQANALGAVTVAAGDTFTVADSAANLQSLTATQITALSAAGVDALDSTGNTLSLNAAQSVALAASNIALTGADVVTLADSGAAIAALTATQIGQLATKLVDAIDASDNALNLTVAQYNALGAITLTGADTVTIVDNSTNISTLTATQLANLSTAGVDAINSSNDIVNLTVAQYNALSPTAVALTAGDTNNLADTGANLAALSTTAISGLAAESIDFFDATDNTLTLSKEQVDATGAVNFATADTVTMTATSTQLQALTTTQITAYGAEGVDRFDSTGSVSLTVAQAQALIAAGMSFVAGDTVKILDTSTNIDTLTTTELSGLSAAGIDSVESTNNPLNITAAEAASAVASGTPFASGNDVFLVDTGANIAALTATQFAGLASVNIDRIDASDNVLNLATAQATNLGAVLLTTTDVVKISDTGANIAGLTTTQITTLISKGVDAIDASNNAVTLTKAQVDGLGSIDLTAADTVTMTATQTELQNLTTTQISSYNTLGIDVFDSTDDAVNFTVAKFNVLNSSGISIAAGDTATVTDTSTALQALSTASINAMATVGIDSVDATNNVLSVTAAQADAYLDAGVGFTAGDAVTVTGTGSQLAAFTATEIADLDSANVDTFDSSNNAITLTKAQVNALGDIVIATADVAVLGDTSTNIESIAATQISALSDANIDRIDASDNVLSLSFDKVDEYMDEGILFTATDEVTLLDTTTQIAAFTTTKIAELGTQGVDVIQASSGNITINAATAIAAITAGIEFEAGTVTLADTTTNLLALTTTQLAALDNIGVDMITPAAALSLTVAKLNAIDASIEFNSGVTITVADTAAAISALTAAQLDKYVDSLGVDVIDATGAATLKFTVAKALELGGDAVVHSSDTAVLADTAANIATLTTGDISDMADSGFDSVDASSAYNLTLAQYNQFVTEGIALTAADVVTLRDTGANLGALTTGAITALATNLIDVIDASDNVLSLSKAQYDVLGAVKLTSADTVTLSDTGGNIDDFTATAIALLDNKFIDHIDLSNNAITLTKDQFTSFASTVLFDNTDVVTVNGTASAESIKAGARTNDFVFNGDAGNDTLTGGAGDDTLNGGDNNDRLIGGAGNDRLDGGSGNDSLTGGTGADTLYGGLGNDTLTGGGVGNDVFVFDTALNASTNVDRITDFGVVAGNLDVIQLDNDVFTAGSLALGTLASNQYYEAAGAAAGTTTDHRIIYNTTTGDLYYDSDGAGGAAAVKFATIANKPLGLDNTFFTIID